MEEYIVTKEIKRGLSVDKPTRFSHKVEAKVGTILVAENDYERIGRVKVLRRKDSGKYICDIGSSIEKECCVKLERESIGVKNGYC